MICSLVALQIDIRIQEEFLWFYYDNYEFSWCRKRKCDKQLAIDMTDIFFNVSQFEFLQYSILLDLYALTKKD